MNKHNVISDIFFYDRHFVELSFKVESLMQNYLNHI